MIWVRTQDGCHLVECSHFAIVKESNVFCIVAPVTVPDKTGAAYGTHLGLYSTYSNALVVLDDIQEYIGKRYKLVYQMPLDDEMSEFNGA